VALVVVNGVDQVFVNGALAGKISEPIPHVQELPDFSVAIQTGDVGPLRVLVGPVEKGEPGTSTRPSGVLI